MTFNKPQNVTLTQMAQWIDSCDSYEDCDKNKQVEYLYHLAMCKAKQLSLFTDPETYDDFAIYCTSKLLSRLTNKDEAHVKSVVNYIKTSIQYWYADYVREFCTGSPNVDMEFDINDFADYLVDESSMYETRSLFYDGFCVTSSLRKHLNNIPKKRLNSEWDNICISCYLTLEDRINSAKNLIQQFKNTETEQLLSRLIRALKNRPPILFHIDESLSSYITVLVNELVHVMSVELTESLGVSVSPVDCLQNMVLAAQNNEDD